LRIGLKENNAIKIQCCVQYVELTQSIRKRKVEVSKTNIKINPTLLSKIIKTLQEFDAEIPKHHKQ
jgi:hypothetical protein